MSDFDKPIHAGMSEAEYEAATARADVVCRITREFPPRPVSELWAWIAREPNGGEWMDEKAFEEFRNVRGRAVAALGRADAPSIKEAT